MSDSDLETGERGQEEAALLAAWISYQESLNEQPPDALSIAAMVHYLCSTQSAGDASQVEQALVSSRVLRGQLREVRSLLDALQSGTWEQAASHAADTGLAGEVARGWQEVLLVRPPMAAQAPQRWLERGWERTLREVGEGVVEARAAWTALLAFGEILRAALYSHVPATARGAADVTPENLQGFPEGICLETAGKVQKDGALNVAVYVQDAEGEPAPQLHGRMLFLALTGAGAALPIASGPIVKDIAEWRLSGFGSALGLPEGPLPSFLFAVSLDEAMQSGSFHSYTLHAELENSGGTRLGASLPVEIRREPHWEHEVFSIEVAAPIGTRLACPNHNLVLELAVAPGCWQRLGGWAMRDWDDEPRVLTANCPGSAEEAAVFPALIRARLQPILAVP